MATKTLKPALKLSTADIRTLSNGVKGEMTSRAALVKALVELGGDTKDNRAVVIGARMALHPLVQRASNQTFPALARQCAELVLAGGMAEDQKKAYAAGREYWSQLLKSAGLTAVDPRGGANNPAGGKPKADRTMKGQGKAKPEAAKPEAAKPEADASAETLSLQQGPREFYRQLAALAFGYSKNRPKLSPEFKALSKAIVEVIDAALK